jgi:hypothetical protein
VAGLRRIPGLDVGDELVVEIEKVGSGPGLSLWKGTPAHVPVHVPVHQCLRIVWNGFQHDRISSIRMHDECTGFID